jgi:uncharacterized lipoprotein YajG
MLNICVWILLLAALVVVAGCKTHPGSREYTPSKGWQQN